MRHVYRAGGLAAAGLILLILGVSACGPLTQGDELQALETRNAQLQGTIQLMGTPAGTIAALQQAATQSVLFENQLNEARGTALAVQATLTVLELSGAIPGVGLIATPAPIAPAGDQAAPAGQAETTQAASTPVQQPASGTRFTNTVTSTGRDNLDCPVGITSVFDSTVSTINVVSRITGLKAGSRISAVWRANGSLFFDDQNCWTPNRDWDEVCAYCLITPDGPTFPTGTWTVELLLDGTLVAQSNFQVVDPQAGMNITPTASGGSTQ